MIHLLLLLLAYLAPLDGVLLLLAARLCRLLDRVEHGAQLRQPVTVHRRHALQITFGLTW